ncbi:MAG: hypothetical protein QNJ94_18360 [Alphaproteobacteria bacterium]|nr:hypothetical protein [Alphaproteobacteria bacterium]
MKRQMMSFLVAAGVVVIFLAGVVWGLETEQPRETGSIVKLSYGPIAEPHAFKAPVTGVEGPLGQCVVCHSIERNGPYRVAPGLWGIVGAEKGRARWFAYSRALSQAQGDWTEDELDKYLTKPNRFLPGTKKTLVGISDSKQRATIIAELKKLSE